MQGFTTLPVFCRPRRGLSDFYPLLQNKLLHIFGSYNLETGIFVILGKALGDRGVFSWIILKLESTQNPIALLQIVYLFLLTGSPKIAVTPTVSIVIVLQPLRNNKVLPQCPHIRSHLNLRKVCNERIAYAIIVKIDFLAVLKLIAHIAAEGWKSENNV